MQWNESDKSNPNDGQMVLIYTINSEYHVARYDLSKRMYQLINYDLEECYVRYWSSFDKI
jgi:hypothetical protein